LHHIRAARLHRTGVKHFRHPVVGPLDLTFDRSSRLLPGSFAVRASSSRAAAARLRELEHGAAAYVLVKGSGPGFQPVGVTDCCLDRPSKLLLGSADGFIELIPVGRAEDQDVDVPDGPLPRLPGVPGRP
jgi:hypothetical protein